VSLVGGAGTRHQVESTGTIPALDGAGAGALNLTAIGVDGTPDLAADVALVGGSGGAGALGVAVSTVVVPAADGASGAGKLAAGGIVDTVVVGTLVRTSWGARAVGEGRLAVTVPALCFRAGAPSAAAAVRSAGSEVGAEVGAGAGAWGRAGIVVPAAVFRGAGGLGIEVAAVLIHAHIGSGAVLALGLRGAGGDISDIRALTGDRGGGGTIGTGIHAHVVVGVEDTTTTGALGHGCVLLAGVHVGTGVFTVVVGCPAAGSVLAQVLVLHAAGVDLSADGVDADTVHVDAVGGADGTLGNFGATLWLFARGSGGAHGTAEGEGSTVLPFTSTSRAWEVVALGGVGDLGALDHLGQVHIHALHSPRAIQPAALHIVPVALGLGVVTTHGVGADIVVGVP